MSDIPIVNTSDYLKGGKVLIDGNEWTVKLPGAGTSLRLNQSERRIKLLDKKIKDEVATELDLDLYDKLEYQILDTFTNIFSDGTEDNKSVKDWVEETPLPLIYQTLEDIKTQSENKVTSGTEETS